VVFADDTLVVQDDASFSARGLGAGDGGFIELSGGTVRLGSVTVDLGSANGTAGTFLIDPWICISAVSPIAVVPPTITASPPVS
jgi:hypothetical protein